MEKPATPEEALTAALTVALTTRRAEKSADATRLADRLAKGMDRATIERCKADAKRRAAELREDATEG